MYKLSKNNNFVTKLFVCNEVKSYKKCYDCAIEKAYSPLKNIIKVLFVTCNEVRKGNTILS